MVEMSTKCVKRGGKWVHLDENAISPMRKKHQSLLSNYNDAPSITNDGFLARPDAQIVALRAHCA